MTVVTGVTAVAGYPSTRHRLAAPCFRAAFPFQFHLVAIALTVVLASVMFGPRLAGKKTSPIALIAVAAVLGAVVYSL